MNIIHFIGENGAIYWVNPIYQPDITESELLSDKIDIDKIGILHRDDGPAVEYPNGSKYWYQNNQSHRTDGPAVIEANGTKTWVVRDTDITDWINEQGISDNPTQEEQVLIRLTWG